MHTVPARSPATAIQMSGLGLRYPGQGPTLADISLRIEPGSFVSVVGPSGCGKSTLLRIIAGLLPPSEGTLRLTSEDQVESTVLQRETQLGQLSFVFQDATLLPWRTVEQNVRLPLELARRSAAEPAVTDVLELVGLATFRQRFPRELSGGMRMRVSLARALVTHPRLLLLDEPFAALDEVTRQMLNEELRRLWQARGWTALFVTHNISEAVFLSERVLVMSTQPGKIVADVPIDLGPERTPALRTDPQLMSLTAQLSDLLRKGGM